MIGALLGIWGFQICSMLPLATDSARSPILGILLSVSIALSVQLLALLAVSSVLGGLMLAVGRFLSSWRSWSFRFCFSWIFLVSSASLCLPLAYSLLKVNDRPIP
jgi:hypothetical protein